MISTAQSMAGDAVFRVSTFLLCVVNIITARSPWPRKQITGAIRANNVQYSYSLLLRLKLTHAAFHPCLQLPRGPGPESLT